MTERLKTPDNKGYNDNTHYLDDEFNWLGARAARIGAEQALRDLEATGQKIHKGRYDDADEIRLSLMGHRDTEKKLRAEIDSKLEAHRADKSLKPLGLDRLLGEAGLLGDSNARTLVLTLAVPALSPRLSERILEPAGLGMFACCTVDELIVLCDPSDKSFGDYVALRRYFRPDSTLVRQGWVRVETYGSGPKDFMGSAVSLTSKGLSLLVGDLGVMSEVDK